MRALAVGGSRRPNTPRPGRARETLCKESRFPWSTAFVVARKATRARIQWHIAAYEKHPTAQSASTASYEGAGP